MKRLLVLLTLFSVGQSFAQPITQTQYAQLVNQVATLQKGLQGPNAPATQAQLQNLQQYVQSIGTTVTTLQAPNLYPLKVYVDPANGNDSNSCIFPGTGACATPQAAYNKKSKWVQLPVVISLACGTYDAGIYVEGDTFSYNPFLGGGPYPDAGWVPGVLVQGTLVSATPATGPQSGSVASATKGSALAYGTFTVSGATWTTNDLTNRFVQITGGTDVGEVRPISSNSAATATIEGDWAITPDSTSTFAIVAPCSTVQDGIKEDTAPPFTSTALNPQLQGSAFIVRENNAPQFEMPDIVFQNLNINPLVAGDGIAAEGAGSNVLVTGVLFTNVGGTATTSTNRGFLHAIDGAKISSVGNVFSPTLAEQAFCAHSLHQDKGGLVSWNQTTGSSWLLKYNILNYSSLAVNIAYFDRALITQYQNTFNSGQTAEYLGDGTRLTAQGNVYNDTLGNVFLIESFSDDQAAVNINFDSETFVGNSASTTIALNVESWGSVFIQFGTTTSSISNFGYAYYINSANTFLEGNDFPPPTPTGTVVSDFLVGDGVGNFSMTQFMAWGQYFSDAYNNHIIGTTNDNWSWQGNTFTPTAGDAQPVILGTMAAPLGAANVSQVDAGTVQVQTLHLPTQKSTTGTRFLCIDSTGNITSSTTACSGT